MFRRSGWLVAVFLAGQLVRPPVAAAHGEKSQSSWTRTSVATFFDVALSKEAVDVGEHLTLTGKLKIMDDWPYVLGPSGIAFLGLNIPGPTFTIQERWINGAFVPGSFEVKPGDFFDFRVELTGRRPGQWHVHPRVDFKGKGPIVGPGFEVAVRSSPAGYSRPVTLLNGKTIDVERYGLSTVLSWHALWILVAGLWAAWWLRRSLFRRYMLVRRGEADEGLVGPGDRRLAVVVGVVTIGLLVGGFAYTSSRYQTLPLQVHRERLPAGDEPPSLAAARMQGAGFDGSRGALRLVLEVTNATDAPVTVDQFISATLTFSRTSARWPLKVEPEGPIPPRAKQQLTLVMATPDWQDLRLVPSDNPLMKMGGLVFFRSSDGARSWAGVFGDVVPDSLRRPMREARKG